VRADSLESELRALVDSHPQIKSKTKAVSSAEQGVRVARSGYLPTVKLSGDEGPEYVDSPDRRLTQGRPYEDWGNSGTLTVSQKIFDGFATDSGVEAAKISHQISGSELRATRQTTLLEGAAAYLDVMRQTKLIALSRENERKVAEQLNLEDERVKKGSGITSDVLSAKQRLQIAKERRVNFEGGFHAAVSKYTQVFGHAPDVAGLADPPLPMDMIPSTMDDSLAVAEKDNPTLESASRSIELSNERRHTAEAGYWPTVDLVGKADYQNGRNAVIGPKRDWSLLLTANWELFSGFKTDAQVAQAAWDHAASLDNQLYAGRKVSEQVRLAWHKLETARERLDLLDNAANIAEEVWKAQQKRREAGKATVTEVLDDETRINDARINYTSAYYDMYQAAYELLAAMGRLEVDSLVRANPPGVGMVLPSLPIAVAKAAPPKPAPAKSAPPVAVAATEAPPPPPVVAMPVVAAPAALKANPVAARHAAPAAVAVSDAPPLTADGLPDGSAMVRTTRSGL
jgi:adhesin transport system outer membrane protein